jgi:(p)ppGpp synthase/HD superfamily hydrolase
MGELQMSNPHPDGSNHQIHLTHRFTRAIDYARVLHIERRKETSIPFMAHLLGVASLVMGESGQVPFDVTEDMVIAAVLHDAVEDHGGRTRLEDVRQNFGDNVARMVEGLSDSLAEEPDKKEDWKIRKEKYLARLPSESRETRLISAADKLYNARTILDEHRVTGANVFRRFKRGRKDQLWYFDSLLTIFKSAGTNRIVDELERVLEKLTEVSANDPPGTIESHSA